MLDSVRTRLTLWYTGVLALVLVAFSIAVYVLLAQSLYARIDSNLRSTIEATTATLVRGIDKQEQGAVATELDEQFFPLQAVAIYDAEGKVVAQKNLRGEHYASLPPRDSIPLDDVRLFTAGAGEQDDGDDAHRVAVRGAHVNSTGKPYFIVASQPLGDVAEELELLRNIFYVVVPAALALAALGGWFLARRGLAPVVAMSERARRIGAENLEQRLPVINPRDELGRLAAAFNELLARLNDSFMRQRQFMADASHELRTPLSVMHTAAGVTLERDHRSESEYRDALIMMDDQTRRLTRIVEDMFTLARADAGSRTLHRADFYLDELLTETVRAAAVLARRKGVTIDITDAPESLINGDEGLLRQMVLNLLDNAIKHTPTSGSVSVSLTRSSDEYLVTVTDTGTGIPLAAQAFIFERFYRADKSRSRSETANGGGAGLGLSIARWIAEAHDGRLELARSDERGSTFVVTLPMLLSC